MRKAYIRRRVPQKGLVCVHVRRGSGTLRCEEEAMPIAVLPEHPNSEHVHQDGTRPCVLPAALAGIVTEELALPADADPCTVYVGQACAEEEGNPFVHAVWFTPGAADTVTGQEPGTHVRATAELHDAWQHVQDQCPRSHNIQPASGAYTELGVGVMAGSGRTSVVVDGQGTSVPFPRNSPVSDAMEPYLREFMSDVSVVLHHVLPRDLLQAHEVPPNCPPQVARAYQYPRLRTGCPQLCSHQVVLRGPRRSHVCMGGEEMDTAALCSMSDLHVDPLDGGGAAGSCTVHTCHASGKELAPTSEESLQHRGLAVFPHRTGGRGVYVKSMAPGWHCAILMQTSARLHGSVVPENSTGLACPHLRLMRVVTYPLIQVENLLWRLARDPDQLEGLQKVSHTWVLSRMQR